MNPTHRLFQRGLVAGICLAHACTTTAATVYFEATDGYASEQANWSSGALPTASDTLAMTNLDTNVMRIQDGDNIKVAVLKVCRNNNDGKNNRQIVRQTGGTLEVNGSGEAAKFAVYANDRSDYWLSDGVFRVVAASGDGIHFSGRGIGAFNMDGGELFVNGSYPRISAWGGRGAIDVRGGVASVTNASFLAIGYKESSHAILTVGGSGRFQSSSDIVASYENSSPTAYVNVLSGGMMAFPRLYNPKSCSTYCNLAGGMIEPFAVAAEKKDFITNVNLVVNSGGARFNTAGRKLHVKPSLQKGNLRAANLHRRWSFRNASLVDSVAGATGSAVGLVSFADGMATLPGGAHGTGYITLQSGGEIMPSDYDGGVTFEFWARPDAIRDYQRVFRLYNGADYLYLTFNKSASDGSKLNQGALKYNGTTCSNDNPTRNWTLGEMYHFAAVLKKNSESEWRLTFYLFDARNGIMREGQGVSFSAAFDPTCFNVAGADFSIGFSNDGSDDASATYDEVRIWKRALTRAELTASATMGPDADFDVDAGLVKDGAGTLVLNGANDYAGVTVVSNGTLSLGAEVRPYHRWSFNGTLEDSEGAFNYLGRKDATLNGSNSAAIVLGEHDVTLPGGANGTAYVRLAGTFGNAIPTNSTDGVTLEFWATQNAIENWSRVFNFANGSSHQAFANWSAGTDNGKSRYQVGYNSATTVKTDDNSPWTLGVKYHLAMVARKDGDNWMATFYKHDAATGALLSSKTLSPPSGWSLATLFSGAFDLGRSASGDRDASATYDEARVWGRPFSAEDLAYSVRLGPDALPMFSSVAESSATLPASTDVRIESDAALCLSGANQTVRTLSGFGTLVGAGSLSVTEGIFPGTDGETGRLTVAGDAVVSGAVTVDLLPDGTCDTLVLASGGTYDVSGLSFAVKDAELAVPHVNYTMLDASGATLVGDIDVSRVPSSFSVSVADGKVVVRKRSGLSVIVF